MSDEHKPREPGPHDAWDSLAGRWITLTPAELAERDELEAWLADPHRDPRAFEWCDGPIGWVRAQPAAAPPEQNGVMTRDQVAALLQVHPTMVTRYVRDRGLPGAKLPGGNEWRFKRVDVVSWLELQISGGKR